MGWAWNAKAGRYYNTGTGRFLSNAKALEFVQASADAAGVATDLLAEYVSEGLVSPTHWKAMMRQEIKTEYIRQYELGIGGRGRMLPADWGSTGGMIGDQYRYLEAFAADLPNLSEAQIRARARMYINSGREAYERAHAKVAEGLGFDEVAWVMNPSAEHCPDCEAFDMMGWQKVQDDPYMGAIPGSGATQCLCITTPESLVLTKRGWFPLLDVQVGDMVWTHRERWRPVVGLTVKPSLDGDCEVMLTHPSGRKVASTAGHLWFTQDGWVAASGLPYIDSSLILCYPSIEEVAYEDLSKVRFEDAVRFGKGPMQIMSPGVSLRSTQGPSGSGVQIMCHESQGQGTMGRLYSRGTDSAGHQSSGQGTQATLRGSRPGRMAATLRWPALELVLAGEQRQEGHDLPLSVGMDHGERTDPQWARNPSHQRRCVGRPTGKSRTDGQARSRQAAWKLVFQQPFDLDVPSMQEDIQGISTGGHTGPQVLFGGVLPRGTAIFDLMVAEDHSFMIEGFVAHNTNCKCGLDYRDSQTGEQLA